MAVETAPPDRGSRGAPATVDVVRPRPRAGRIISLDVTQANTIRLALLATCALGVIVRAPYSLRASFPLNDGGLFYQMSAELQAAGYALPASVPYNGADIPFAYPPLGLYASALLADATPLSLYDVFLYLPLAVSCLTVPAFFLLARELLPTRTTAIAATLAFALIPRSFIWIIMGGGVTRSFGLLFALLALLYIARMTRIGLARHVLAASAFTALTFLSHLESGWFLAISATVILLTSGRIREAAPRYVILGVAVSALAAPWWISVIARHGIEPFVAAGGTGGSIFTQPEAAWLGLARMSATSEPFFPVLGMLGVLGAIYCLVRRQFFLPLWWMAIILFDLRAFPTFTTLPLALCAGIAVTQVLVPALAAHVPDQASVSGGQNRARLEHLPVAVTVALAALIAFACAGALVSRGGLDGESNVLKDLTDSERAALAWVANETPPESRFLVVPRGSWETERTAEWFPVLADRVSVATVQGSEWLPNDAFDKRVRIQGAAYLCGYATTACLERLTRDPGSRFEYVYLPKTQDGQCCWELKRSLFSDSRYELAYEGPGATIFHRRAS